MKIFLSAIVLAALLLGCGANLSCPPYTRRVVAVGRIGTFYIEIRSPGWPSPSVLVQAVKREALWHCQMLGYSRADLDALKIWRPYNRDETWGATLAHCRGEGSVL